MNQLNPEQLKRHLASVITDQEFINRAVADYAREWQPEPAPIVEIIPPEERNRTVVELYVEEMQDGSSRLLSAIDNARHGRPTRSKSRLIWRNATHIGQDHYGEYQPKVAPVQAVRSPCMGCGVRYDVHDAFGCGRWRA